MCEATRSGGLDHHRKRQRQKEKVESREIKHVSRMLPHKG